VCDGVCYWPELFINHNMVCINIFSLFFLLTVLLCDYSNKLFLSYICALANLGLFLNSIVRFTIILQHHSVIYNLITTLQNSFTIQLQHCETYLQFYYNTVKPICNSITTL
jgi:hypothetical protein